MSLQQMLIETLEPLTGLPVTEDFFGGSNEEYIAFTVNDDRAALVADDVPQEDVVTFTVHVFLKKNTNYRPIKKNIRNALLEQECEWPVFSVLNEPDDKTRHLIFETSWINDEDIN